MSNLDAIRNRMVNMDANIAMGAPMSMRAYQAILADVGALLRLVDASEQRTMELIAANGKLAAAVMKVRELHAESGGCCESCATGPWDYNPVEWPCPTAEAVGE